MYDRSAARSLELFLQRVCSSASAIATERKSKTLYVRQVDRLKQLCEKVPAPLIKAQD